jgi:hypothetical protein
MRCERRPWNSKEDKILRKKYPAAPWLELLRLLRGRTRVAIFLHAERQLCLKRVDPNKKPYSEEEKRIINKLFPNPNVPREVIIASLPGRTWHAVNVFARNYLALKRPRVSPIWSEEQTKIFSEALLKLKSVKDRYAAQEIIEELEKTTGRKPKSIKNKLYDAGFRLTKIPEPEISPEDEELLKSVNQGVVDKNKRLPKTIS